MDQGRVVTACVAGVIGLVVGLYLAPQPGGGSPEAGVRKLLEEQQSAWNRGDLDGFMAGYWDDEELTFYAGDTVNKGFKAVRERYRKNYQAGGKEMGRLTFGGLEVREMAGDWAQATGTWRVVVKDGTSEGTFRLWLRRFAPGWKIVMDHTKKKE